MSGDDLFLRLWVRRDSIAATMRDATAKAIGLAGISAAKSSTLFDDMHYAIARTLVLCPDDAPNTDTDLEYFAVVGRRYAANSMSVTALEAACQVSYLAALRQCLSLAGPDDHDVMTQLAAWGAREVPRVKLMATSAFATARRQAGDGGPARLLLARHLVEGIASNVEADAAGVELPQGYLVLLCQVRHPAGRVDTMQLAAVEHYLQSVPNALWLVGKQRTRLLVLLPFDDDITSASSVSSDLVDAIGDIVGQAVCATQATCVGIDAVPAAVKEVEQAIALVAAMPDSKCRPYRMEDLLVELAVLRQPTLRRRLTELLVPLDSGPDLRHTLEVLFSLDLDRERTARALYIHRRTLTYRIQRIHKLIGIDPASPHGIQLLRAMLTATKLSSLGDTPT